MLVDRPFHLLLKTGDRLLETGLVAGTYGHCD